MSDLNKLVEKFAEISRRYRTACLRHVSSNPALAYNLFEKGLAVEHAALEAFGLRAEEAARFMGLCSPEPEAYHVAQGQPALEPVERAASRYRACIGAMTVGADLPVILYGPVRGLVSQHESLDAARVALARDHAGCRRQGGYSDARVYAYTSGRWVVQD